MLRSQDPRTVNLTEVHWS